MLSITRRAALLGTLSAAFIRPSFGASSDEPAAFTDIDIDRAKAEGPVMLYTSLDTKVIDAVIAGFKSEYGIEVKYFRGGGADVTSKLLAESDAGSVRADVVDSADMAAILLMKQKGILRPFKSEAASVVPENLRDPDGFWISDRLTQAVIQYNTNEFGTASPKSWADLADPRMKGRLTFFSSSNGDGAPRLYTLAKAFGWDLLKSYAALDPLRAQSPQVVTQLLESGERGAAFLTNDNIALRSKQQARPTNYIYPAEGVPTEPSAIGLVKDSTRPHAASLFLEFWMGKKSQAELVKSGKYSSRSDVDAPQGNPPMSSLKLITLDYSEYLENRDDILDQLADIFGGEWGN